MLKGAAEDLPVMVRRRPREDSSRGPGAWSKALRRECSRSFGADLKR